jgi:hypothetical protein
MDDSKTKELLEKWQAEYPQACKQLSKSVEIIDEQLGALEIPTDMLIDFHLCIIEGLINHVQSDTKNGALEQIRFEQINRLMEFNWSGKRFRKINNDFAGQKSNCKCMDTDVFHKFKPDDICLIPAKFVKHQNAVAC